MLKSPDNSYSDFVKKVWADFEICFPDEKTCWLWLFEEFQRRRLLFCRLCGSFEVSERNEKRSLYCISCKKTCSITAKTFFHRVRKLRAWIGALWLFDHRAFVNSATISQFVGVSPSSALHISRSIMAALDRQAWGNDFHSIEIGTVHFLDTFRKRSLVTPRWQSPRDEEFYEQALSAFSQDDKSDVGDSTTDSKSEEVICIPLAEERSQTDEDHQSRTLSEQESQILALLEGGALSLDQLLAETGIEPEQLNAIITELELDELIVTLAGGRIQLRTPEPEKGPREGAPTDAEGCLYFDCQYCQASSEADGKNLAMVKILLSSFKGFVYGLFGGISRKTMQYYLAVNPYRQYDPAVLEFFEENTLKLQSRDSAADDSRFGDNIAGPVSICLASDYIGSALIRAFVTPLMVKLRA
ncbi:MAG: hypothetical protein K2Y32_15550 [Candidatus Obscuribacterales bacterium]|nr:hypothetical protein [Candidatus Obscuribacterales bacterium]